MEQVSKKMEQVLEEGSLVTTAQGISMLPWIRPGRDALVLEKPRGSIQKFDAVLYKRKNGTYILHRVLEIREKDYVLCGDNQYIKEYGIQEFQIIGILRGFFRGKRYIDCRKCRRYRGFVKVWCASLQTRRAILCSINLCRRVWRKLKWKKT